MTWHCAGELDPILICVAALYADEKNWMDYVSVCGSISFWLAWFLNKNQNMKILTILSIILHSTWVYQYRHQIDRTRQCLKCTRCRCISVSHDSLSNKSRISMSKISNVTYYSKCELWLQLAGVVRRSRPDFASISIYSLLYYLGRK